MRILRSTSILLIYLSVFLTAAGQSWAQPNVFEICRKAMGAVVSATDTGALKTVLPLANTHSIDVEYENISFGRSDRTPESVVSIHGTPAQKFLNKTYLADKKILDAGCGGEGFFVRNLRAQGIEATGIDLIIDYKGAEEYLFARDMLDNKFPDKNFDVVISTYSLASYLTMRRFGPPENLLHKFQDMLSEMIRVTKVGGLVLLAPIDFEIYTLEQMLVKAAGVEIVSSEIHKDYPPQFGKKPSSLILRRVK
jgi:SAM-dependent methyltransferase